MSITWNSTRHLSLLLVLPSLLGGCARQGLDADPSQIPSLQEQLSQNPGDLTAQTRLGIAFYKDGRFEQARTTLANAVEAGAESGAAYLYLGLSNESLEDWAGAREAYTTYLDVGNWGPLKDDLEDRLLLIVRNELQAAAQAALAQEAELVAEPPEPRTVAVFPFRLISDNEGLLPLQVALADMMITDLAISNALTVLERTQIQSLLDEMALSEAGYADPATGARAGRLLRSEHVVQGVLTTLGQENIRFDTEVMNTVQGRSAGSLSDQDQLEAIFDMEKGLVFQILDVLGAVLTPAEREAINENRAESILAFL
ncbi:MAG: tetratricopeptide repeat protein, partial [Longimicrobiales bacterium]